MTRTLAAGLLVLLLAGCASVPTTGGETQTPSQVDPWEAWNRKVFAFNDAIDEALLKPVAEGYRKVLPQFVRTGVDNFFGNIGDAWSSLNQFLQGKPQDGLEMGMRVVTNTVFGAGGLFDLATELRITKRYEDFGQTLGRWGVPTGPYVVLPILGPSTLRDGSALALDLTLPSPARLVDETAGKWQITGVQLINARAGLLAATELLSEIALDRYSFARDAYLQRRLDQVHDGAPPLENFDDEPAEPAPTEPVEPAPKK